MTEDRSDELREWYAEDDIDGADLLDDLLATLTRYVVFPDAAFDGRGDVVDRGDSRAYRRSSARRDW